MSSRAGKWIGGIILVILGILVVLYNWTYWNALRGPISRAIENKTGRQFVIEGDRVKHAAYVGWLLV